MRISGWKQEYDAELSCQKLGVQTSREPNKRPAGTGRHVGSGVFVFVFFTPNSKEGINSDVLPEHRPEL